MEQPKAKEVLNTLNINKIWLPLLLGIAVPLYLFINDKDFTWASVRLMGEADWRYLVLGVLAAGIRDLGYILRLRILTHGKLSWIAGFYIIMLWEFSSAVTPSVVGGSVIAVFLLTREGINFGKALAYIMVASIFDNLCFLTAASLGLGGAYGPIFTGTATLEASLSGSLQIVFWSSYIFILFYTLAVLLSLLFLPVLFKWILVSITSLPFLKRWQPAARQQGDEIIMASSVLQGESTSYWLKVGLVTLISWTSKYFIVNFIMAAYTPLSLSEHVLVFGKQLIMWIVMLVSPTPGSSGTAEFFYKQLHGVVLGEYTLITAVIWRILTSYYYLMMGAMVLPRWVRRMFAAKNSELLGEETYDVE